MGIPLQRTAASLECVQLEVSVLYVQLAMPSSIPMHLRLTRWIGPVPWPRAAPTRAVESVK